ncbi:MAG TPA: phasin family protein [Actinomycetota bacterium]|nr:phasin family protein [Actinomycetota bacterium]
MREDVRRYVDAVLDRLSPSKAQEMARAMAGGSREQVNRFAKELMDWSQRNRERLTELVRREVRSQLKALGVASRDDLEALKKRVRELERAGRSAAARATAKAPSSRAGRTKSTG